MLRITEQRF